jgi:hypothetical protein
MSFRSIQPAVHVRYYAGHQNVHVNSANISSNMSGSPVGDVNLSKNLVTFSCSRKTFNLTHFYANFLLLLTRFSTSATMITYQAKNIEECQMLHSTIHIYKSIFSYIYTIYNYIIFPTKIPLIIIPKYQWPHRV